jgi:hypothetical protein
MAKEALMPSIAYCEKTATIYVYSNGGSFKERSDYDGVVSVFWESDDCAMLYGANGITGRKTLLKIFAALYERGARRLRMKRAKKHKMPFAKLVEEGRFENTWEIDLSKALNISVN